jgi:hypothetical protein
VPAGKAVTPEELCIIRGRSFSDIIFLKGLGIIVIESRTHNLLDLAFMKIDTWTEFHTKPLVSQIVSETT